MPRDPAYLRFGIDSLPDWESAWSTPRFDIDKTASEWSFLFLMELK